MRPLVLVGEVEEEVRLVKPAHDLGQWGQVHCDVRSDAAPVIHRPAIGGLEREDGGVRLDDRFALLVMVGIIDLLNATAAGDVVLRHGHLQLAVVEKVPCLLHEAFPIGAVAHDHSAVQIL